MTQSPPGQLLDASLRHMPGYNLKRVYLAIREAVLRELEQFDLKPPSFSALVIICDNPDLSQSRLAQALNVKRSGMVVIIDELEQLGLINRNAVPGDRRSHALRATLKGLQVRKRAMKAVTRAESHVLSEFSSEEQQLLANLFTRLENSNTSARQSGT